MGIIQIVCLSIGCDIDGCDNGKDFYGEDYSQAQARATDEGWAIWTGGECHCPGCVEQAIL